MNEHEKYFEEKFKKIKKSFFFFFFIAMVFWLIFTAIYGSYKFITKDDDKQYIKTLESIVTTKQQIIDDKKVEIDQLKKGMENFYEAHVMENFLLMLLNEEQKKQFATLEDYLKPYMYNIYKKNKNEEKEKKK